MFLFIHSSSFYILSLDLVGHSLPPTKLSKETNIYTPQSQIPRTQAEASDDIRNTLKSQMIKTDSSQMVTDADQNRPPMLAKGGRR